jgi:hypothetical protein
MTLCENHAHGKGMCAMSIFGFKQKKGEVLNHWFAPIEGFSYPPSEFYAAVEKELAAMKVPSMDISRVEFAEGGLLSSKRVYLRMIRERLAVDVCAAPFGTGYFFSCRSVYIPPVIEIWHVVVLFVVFSVIYSLLAKFLGAQFAMMALVGLILAIAQIFRNAISMGLSDLDATLIKIPIIGPIYELWFRKETYYRADTRLAYLATVPTIVKRLAENTTGTIGFQLKRQYEQAPILGDLYKPVAVPENSK